MSLVAMSKSSVVVSRMSVSANELDWAESLPSHGSIRTESGKLCCATRSEIDQMAS